MITYRVRQDNTSWSRYPKHFFAHSVNLRTVETSELAAIIQSNCSVKRSDVMAVLIELGETCTQRIEQRAGSTATSDSFSICFLLVCFTLS